MTGKQSEIEGSTDVCTHGNFIGSCEPCLAENALEQRRQRLQRLSAELDTVVDGLGEHIDMGIRDTLVGLQANGSKPVRPAKDTMIMAMRFPG